MSCPQAAEYNLNTNLNKPRARGVLRRAYNLYAYISSRTSTKPCISMHNLCIRANTRRKPKTPGKLRKLT